MNFARSHSTVPPTGISGWKQMLLRPIVGLADCNARDNADGKSKSPYGPGGIYHEKQVGSLCARASKTGSRDLLKF